MIEVNTIVASTLDAIRGLEVRIPDPEAIIDYLDAHPDLTGIVLVACMAAENTFGPETRLSLERYRDPEIHDEYLTLYVRQVPYDQGIMKKIRQVASLVEEALANTSGWLHITTDFANPR